MTLGKQNVLVCGFEVYDYVLFAFSEEVSDKYFFVYPLTNWEITFIRLS